MGQRTVMLSVWEVNCRPGWGIGGSV